MRISYSIENLSRRVYPNCLGYKCVYSSNVISIYDYALLLLFSVYNKKKLRRIFKDVGDIHLVARKISYRLRNNMEIDLLSLEKKYPKELVDLFRANIEKIQDDPWGFIEKYNVKNSLDFEQIKNDEDVILINKKWFWWTISFLSYRNTSTELVLCNNKECYPLPLGIYPGYSLIGLAYDLGDEARLLESLGDKYGSILLKHMILNYIDLIDSIALAVKRVRRAVLFLYTSRSLDRLLDLFVSFQLDALSIEQSFLRERIGITEEEIDDYTINRVISEVLNS